MLSYCLMGQDLALERVLYGGYPPRSVTIDTKLNDRLLDTFWGNIDESGTKRTRENEIRKATQESLRKLGLDYQYYVDIPIIASRDLEQYLLEHISLPQINSPTKLLLAVFNTEATSRIGESLRVHRYFSNRVIPKLKSLAGPSLAELLRKNRVRNDFTRLYGEAIKAELQGLSELTLTKFKSLIQKLKSNGVITLDMPSDYDLTLIMQDLGLKISTKALCEVAVATLQPVLI